VVTVVALAGARLLNLSLSARAGSSRFYLLTLAVALTYLAGALGSGPVPLERGHPDRRTLARHAVGPVLLGVATFAVFYGCALVARHIPVLRAALASVLGYANHGSQGLVWATTLANGAAEEVFFRGAVYAALGEHHPVAASTALYALVTAATRNPALVLAAVVMGTLFGWQRRAGGGIAAPMVTHLTWSTLMLRYLPPLFHPADAPA
jgi:hypothetical protein